MKITVTKGKDGWWVSQNLSMPGCVSQGKTAISALRNLADAMTAIEKVKRA
jgi:predicted RNase H-like HicB family nuclease